MRTPRLARPTRRPLTGRNKHSALRRRTGSRSCAETGFTLIEIVTVIVILGILSAFVFQKYMGIVDEAREARGADALNRAVAEFNLAFMKYAVATKSAATELSQISGEDYLNLSGGMAERGEYRFTYTSSGSTVHIGAEIQTSSGWEAVTDAGGVAMTRDIPWP
ncbi:MAG: type II secretion system protein [Desulfovibrionaceae bacterium]